MARVTEDPDDDVVVYAEIVGEPEITAKKLMAAPVSAPKVCEGIARVTDVDATKEERVTVPLIPTTVTYIPLTRLVVTLIGSVTVDMLPPEPAYDPMVVEGPLVGVGE
jgi:hypothetical protein